ncbi:hypothetical protein AAHB47_28525 [Bacillus wiedmannii]
MRNFKHEHKEGFVPQYLLEKLAKEGSKEAAETLAKTASIKEKKIKTTNEVSVSNRTGKNLIVLSMIVKIDGI